MAMTQIQPPAAAPLALPEIRAFLRLDHEADDALLSALIAAATHACESFTGRALITQRWRLALPWLHDRRVALGRGPVQQVDAVRLIWRDTSTALQTSTYWLDQSSEPPILRIGDPGAGGLGPAILEIDYTAGYGDDWNAVPMSLRQGMLRLIGYLYRVRDGNGEGETAASLPSAVAALWAPFRVMRL